MWRGTSTGLVRPSSRNDKMIVYGITRLTPTDSVAIDGRSIVNGQEVEIGVPGCRIATPDAQILCSIPSGAWRFTICGDSLAGELTLRDTTLFRVVRTARQR